MRRSLHLIVALIALVAAFGPRAARAATATVEVRDNFFTPDALEIDVGDAVAWAVIDGGHTVRSSDEVDGVPLFELPAGSATLRSGELHDHVFAEPGAYAYYCEVHPGSMTGVVYVDVEPPQPAVRRVPAEYRTVGAALDEAPPGTTIEISPGVYSEEVTVDERDVTLRGMGVSPSDVVFDGRGTLNAGFTGFADGIRVENLTVQGYASRGLYLRGADRFRIHRVHAVDNGEYGVRVRGSRGGGITDSVARGSPVSGVSIAECDLCGTLIQRITASDNGAGVLIENSGHVLVLASQVSANTVGIAVTSSVPQPSDALRTQAPTRGATIRGNTLSGNATGILVQGGWHVEVTQNSVTAGEVGVAVNGAPVASVRVAVRDNVLTGYTRSGLVWDLLGAEVCFSGNHDPARTGAAPQTEPPQLQSLFAC